MNNKLVELGKSKSKFLKLQDGESVQAVFVDSKDAVSKFGQPVGEYLLRLEDGTTKTLTSAAGNLMTTLGALSGGEKLVITRHGEGTKTKYEVDVLEEGDVFEA